MRAISDSNLVNRVRLEVLDRTIETTNVPSAGEVAGRLGLAVSDVVDAFKDLGDSHVFVLEPGDPTRLRMANPFSGVPSAFPVFARGRKYHGNCVWDALGIVALLGGDGKVETSCPDCGHPLTLEVAGRALVRAEGVVHFSVPARRWWDDIVFT